MLDNTTDMIIQEEGEGEMKTKEIIKERKKIYRQNEITKLKMAYKEKKRLEYLEKEIIEFDKKQDLLLKGKRDLIDEEELDLQYLQQQIRKTTDERMHYLTKDCELNQLFKNAVESRLIPYKNGKPIPLAPYPYEPPLHYPYNQQHLPPSSSSIYPPNQHILSNDSGNSKHNINTNTTTTTSISTTSNKSTTYYNQDMRPLNNFNDKKYEEERYKKHDNSYDYHNKSYKNNYPFRPNFNKHPNDGYSKPQYTTTRGGAASKMSRPYKDDKTTASPTIDRNYKLDDNKRSRSKSPPSSSIVTKNDDLNLSISIKSNTEENNKEYKRTITSSSNNSNKKEEKKEEEYIPIIEEDIKNSYYEEREEEEDHKKQEDSIEEEHVYGDDDYYF